jgi:predicted anti-sigma-YlaC factor YlaD
MKCKEVRSLFSEFYNRELNQQAIKLLEEHLSGCSECQEEYLRFKKILKILGKWKPLDTPCNYLNGMKSAGKTKVDR